MTAPCIATEERSGISPGRWQQLADDVLAGETIHANRRSPCSNARTMNCSILLAAAYRVRRRWFGNQVQLYFLMNAKSGLCPEDCGYCSQSKVSEAEIPRYNLLSREKLLDGAPHGRRAKGAHVLHRRSPPADPTSAKWRPSRRSFRRSSSNTT